MEFPSTSTAEDIPTQECFVAQHLSELQIDQQNEPKKAFDIDIDISQVNYEALTDLQTETPTQTSEIIISSAPDISENEFDLETPGFATPLKTEEPTAPSIEPVVLPVLAFVHSSNQSQTKVVYPSLDQIKDELSATNVHTSILSQIKPFTLAQLGALYSNPEIECAQSFEREFIHNELKTNDNKHVLFELLTKYARCRHAFRMNRLDVDSTRKSLETDTTNLWAREKKTIQYQTTCEDGVVVRASESYE